MLRVRGGGCAASKTDGQLQLPPPDDPPTASPSSIEAPPKLKPPQRTATFEQPSPQAQSPQTRSPQASGRDDSRRRREEARAKLAMALRKATRRRKQRAARRAKSARAHVRQAMRRSLTRRRETQRELAKLPNKNKPSSYGWLRYLLSDIAQCMAPAVSDLSTHDRGTPLFVVAGACPSIYAGMQCVMFSAMAPLQAEAEVMPTVDFWWIKPIDKYQYAKAHPSKKSATLQTEVRAVPTTALPATMRTHAHARTPTRTRSSHTLRKSAESLGCTSSYPSHTHHTICARADALAPRQWAAQEQPREVQGRLRAARRPLQCRRCRRCLLRGLFRCLLCWLACC